MDKTHQAFNTIFSFFIPQIQQTDILKTRKCQATPLIPNQLNKLGCPWRPFPFTITTAPKRVKLSQAKNLPNRGRYHAA